MALFLCNQIPPTGIDYNKLIVSYLPLIAGILTLAITLVVNNKNINSQKEADERKEIYKKLNEFYGPLLQLRLKSNLLYKKFSEKFNSDGNHFRTLTYLLEGNKFDGNEEEILKEIIEIGEQCEKLIHEKAGLIDDQYLRTEILPKATTHFLILRMAYKGLLKGEADKYSDLTFPAELNKLLEKRKAELESELNRLNSKRNLFSLS